MTPEQEKFLTEKFIRPMVKKTLCESSRSDFEFQDLGNKFALYESGMHVVTFPKSYWLDLCKLIQQEIR